MCKARFAKGVFTWDQQSRCPFFKTDGTFLSVQFHHKLLRLFHSTNILTTIGCPDGANVQTGARTPKNFGTQFRTKVRWPVFLPGIGLGVSCATPHGSSETYSATVVAAHLSRTVLPIDAMQCCERMCRQLSGPCARLSKPSSTTRDRDGAISR